MYPSFLPLFMVGVVYKINLLIETLPPWRNCEQTVKINRHIDLLGKVFHMPVHMSLVFPNIKFVNTVYSLFYLLCNGISCLKTEWEIIMLHPF